MLRAGYGMSYERVEGNYIYGAASQVPFISNVSLGAGNVDALAGTNASILPPQAISNTSDRNLAPPRIHNWSLGMQQRLSSSTTAELGYVGSYSGNLTWLQNLNQGTAGHGRGESDDCKKRASSLQGLCRHPAVHQRRSL